MASLALSIGLISFLKRRDELIVPSWPTESITTGMASVAAVVTPRMLPIKQLLLTLKPTCPIAITLSAVVTPPPAKVPKAVLLLPVVLAARALRPTAVLSEPLVLSTSALIPLAVLDSPVVL